ncbi:uncharacterized protein FIBRA_07373 [Fibroporia radiculosa]|uniref:prephenate dehydratase n=1 Tax=Fibroporia radiculosa TaxID=599839 RepID=J4H4K8_9APHY|nr:uncharacterized protein FIBRA_07373 [Fibroporia radiculosa]CCM05164.1 predicted protein [Fibroporia radiculosa]
MTVEPTSLPKLAFLGPLGSHSHQCAQNGFGPGVEYVERSTITGTLLLCHFSGQWQMSAEAFKAVSDEIPFALIPQENSLYGTVTDTYDLLRLPEVGQHKFVRGEVTLSVRHCLVVRRGVKLRDIGRVLSHEQALGQCARFLSTNLPGAARIKMSSTSAAAQALLSEDKADQLTESAALCSAACAKMHPELEILQESVQDSNTNCTRFYVIGKSLDVKLPSTFHVTPPRHALVRMALRNPDMAPDATVHPRNRLVQLVLSTLLATFGLPVTRIDRRPSLTDVPFEDVYMVELENPMSALSVGAEADVNLLDSSMWSRMAAGVKQVEAAGGDATVLGIW